MSEIFFHYHKIYLTYQLFRAIITERSRKMKVRRIHHKNRKSAFWYEMRLQVLIYKAFDKVEEEERKNPAHGESNVYAPELGGWIPVSEYNRRTNSNIKDFAYDARH